jgi:ABC-type nitrate/sulfonate/bicarbonate transport system substrate-binding protein
VKRTSFTVRAAGLLCALVLGTINVAAAATDHVKLGIGPAYPTYAIFAAARELGYYARQNLDVEVQSFRAGAGAQDALAAGNVDLCTVVPIDALHAIRKGVKERIVAMYAPAVASGWYIMVPSASPLTTVGDLNGKSVGVTQAGSLGDFWVQAVAKSAKITMTSVPLDVSVENALMAKRVDAAVLWAPASYQGLMGGELRALVDLETTIPPTVSEGIAASQGMIDKRPDVLRRWLTATSNAVRYMQNNQIWSEKFLRRYLGDNDEQSVHLVYANVIMKIGAAGSMHPDWMRSSLAFGTEPATPGVKPAVAPPLTGSVFLTGEKPKKKR